MVKGGTLVVQERDACEDLQLEVKGASLIYHGVCGSAKKKSPRMTRRQGGMDTRKAEMARLHRTALVWMVDPKRHCSTEEMLCSKGPLERGTII